MTNTIEIIDAKTQFKDERLQKCDKGYYHVVLSNEDECQFLSKHYIFDVAFRAAEKAAKQHKAEFID